MSFQKGRRKAAGRSFLAALLLLALPGCAHQRAEQPLAEPVFAEAAADPAAEEVERLLAGMSREDKAWQRRSGPRALPRGRWAASCSTGRT